MLTVRRGFVPLCLTLGIAFALPLLADPPSQPSAAASGAQTIALQHVVSSDLVKRMHWDVLSQLPAGVSQIVSVPVQNALLVTATPAGLAQVRQIVKIFDVEPHQVQIKFALASVSDTDLKALRTNLDLIPPTASDLKQGLVQYANGYTAARFRSTLALRQAVTEEPDMTTSSNVESSVTLSTTALPAATQQIRVTPRINPDNSITLDLHAAFSEGTGKQSVNTFHTVKSGESLLLILPPAEAGEQNLLLFATPTIK